MIKDLLYLISDHILWIPFALVFLASIVISIKSRFIQIRALPKMFKMIFQAPKRLCTTGCAQTISPRSALWVSLSTCVGMGNIAGPIIAIGLGGPGALAGFIVASFFGAAVGYVEVFLAIKYRKKQNDGSFLGGAMQYLDREFTPWLGLLYAFATGLLMLSWSAGQANQLAILLAAKGIPTLVTGTFLTAIVIFVLVGGIKRLGAICDKIVPVMFIAYCAATLWIISLNFRVLPEVFGLMFTALFSPVGIVGITMGYGMQKAIRWGLARAVQATETGVGTLTFPHSAARGTTAYNQGVMAIATTFGNGIICLLTGLTIMTSGAWKIPGATFDIRMFSNILASYFPTFGPNILIFCAILFAFGTIIGNGYNGSICFLHTTKNRWLWLYYAISGVAVFIGSIMDVKLVWTIIDFFILPVVIPHMIAIVILAFKSSKVQYHEDMLNSPMNAYRETDQRKISNE
ncbi:sodium:alanine symporter family protein [Candidatus Babeliales bacterium]|nr:sodium:alanine symporter family protein [Candidatus Babeliales bacterium]